jgi:hypothetical protein
MKIDSMLTPEKRKALAKAKKKNPWHTELLTVHGFEALHRAGSFDRNGGSALLELVTAHHDIQIKRVDCKKGYFDFYLSFPSTPPHGFGKHELQVGWSAYSGDYGQSEYWGLVLRKGNKTIRITNHMERNLAGCLKHDQLPYELSEILGKASEQFENLTVLYDVKRIGHKTDLEKALTLTGWRILDAFTFHSCITFKPEYVKVAGFKIEFGLRANKSLPRVATFDLNPKLAKTKLVDLGIEKSDSYPHHTTYTVLTSQADEAKKFSNKFNATKQKFYVSR